MRSPGHENYHRLQMGLLARRLDFRCVGPWVVDVWLVGSPTNVVRFWPTTGRVAGTTRRGWSALCERLGVDPYLNLAA